MKQINSSVIIKLPEGVSCTVNSRRVGIKGPRGELFRNFRHKAISVKKSSDGKKLIVELWHGVKRDVNAVKTIKSHIDNMITGVIQGYRYKMRFVYAHFPISFVINDDGKGVEIRNFLGEKVVRKVPLQEGVSIVRSTNVKDEIVLEGNDIELVSKSCARINQSCLVRHKDIRKFLDGIYVSEKGAIPIDE